MGQPDAPSFGLDDFGLDDRMRLFGYVTAENRVAYLWVLRAFDAARATYHVVLHTTEVAATLADMTAANSGCPDPAGLELPRLLDALVDWGVLDRGQDGARATTLARFDIVQRRRIDAHNTEELRRGDKDGKFQRWG